MFTKTLQDAKEFNQSEDTQRLAYEYLALRAKAEVTREAIDKIKQPIFEKYSFVEVMHDRSGKVRLNRPITDLKDVWMHDDEKYTTQYFNECSRAIAPEWRDRTLAEYGKDVLEGYCPALIAESAVNSHVTKCLEHMAAWMGVEVPYNYKLRNQMFDLFMQGVFAKDE
jgi:hypothetical protein